MLLCSKINRCDNIGIFPNDSIQTGAPLWNDMSKEIHKTDYQSLLGMGGNRSNKSDNSHGRWKVLHLPSNLTRNKLVDSILLIEIVQFIFTFISMITQQGWKCHISIHFTYNMKSNASEGTIKWKGFVMATTPMTHHTCISLNTSKTMVHQTYSKINKTLNKISCIKRFISESQQNT